MFKPASRGVVLVDKRPLVFATGGSCKRTTPVARESSNPPQSLQHSALYDISNLGVSQTGAMPCTLHVLATLSAHADQHSALLSLIRIPRSRYTLTNKNWWIFRENRVLGCPMWLHEVFYARQSTVAEVSESGPSESVPLRSQAIYILKHRYT